MRARLAAQLPLDERAAQADVLLDNEGTVEELRHRSTRCGSVSSPDPRAPRYPAPVLRAVLFDAGETLVHPAPSFPELFVRVLARAGHERSLEDVVTASGAVLHRFSEAAADRELWTTSPERSARFWTSVYERMLGELGVADGDGLAVSLYATFTDRANYALFDDVPATLDALDAARA